MGLKIPVSGILIVNDQTAADISVKLGQSLTARKQENKWA